MPTFWRRLIFGSPLRTERLIHERLSNILALPVFASDALSSSAYATEEILLVLVLVAATPAALQPSIYIALGIAVLLAIVATSYRQTIYAYPQGGGAYRVSRENLGLIPGLTAAAALLIDYVLTVAVSIAAGVAAITSAIPALAGHRVELAVGLVVFVMLANLRGVRESGTLFAIPTYSFVAALSTLVLVGLWRVFTGTLGAPPLPPPGAHAHTLAGALLPLVFLRAFASGCTALTGIEAVSDGVPAFRPPEARNAARTLSWMAAILIFLFLGITFLANRAQITPFPAEVVGGEEIHRHTVISQIAVAVFGFETPIYFAIQGATALILVLAANTSFADFPRLSMFLARDRFLPRQMANIGDRLVFSNGIVLLAGLASLLLIAFHASTHHLIPLYAVGVFVSFTLSQAGMVMRWRKRREGDWRRGALISSIGAIVTGVVLVIIASVKFTSGAYLVVLLIPLLVLTFLQINRHYKQVAAQLSMERYQPIPRFRHTVIVLAPDVHQGIMQALAYARSISPHVRAVYVELEPEKTPRVQERWQRWVPDLPLVVLPSPYRGLVGPVLDYLEEVKAERHDDVVTVVIPEFVTPHWWTKLLHNQSGLLLKFALLFRRDIVVTNVRYYLQPIPTPAPEELTPASGRVPAFPRDESRPAPPQRK
ncbi:MAG: APC family permease [Armatimonadetes bacterium]|nr:APC family permease [Armatimonadota bacterium]